MHSIAGQTVLNSVIFKTIMAPLHRENVYTLCSKKTCYHVFDDKLN